MQAVINILYELTMYGLVITFLPQIIRIIKKRNVEGISLIAFLGFGILQFISAVHGYYTHNTPLLISMILSMIATGIIVLQIVYYRVKHY